MASPVLIGTPSHANSGAGSVTTLSIPIPSGAAVDDLAMILFANERGSQLPTVTAPTAGVQVGDTVGSTNIGITVAWKRLTAGDLGGVITATYAVSRQLSGGISVWRGAADPTFTNSSTVFDSGGAAAGTITTPSVTPSAADVVLLGFIAWSPVAAPWVRTLAPASGWTEEFEDTSGTGTAISGHSTIAHRTLVGQSGVLQTGYVATPSDLTSHMTGFVSTAVLIPGTVVTPGASGPVRVGASVHVNGGPSSVLQLDLPIPAGAIANDLLLGFFGNERGDELPVLSSGSGTPTVAFQIGGTNLAATHFWKRLTAADISVGHIRATWAAGRRVAAGGCVLRGAADPLYTPGSLFDAGGAAPGVISFPNATPSVADSLLLGQIVWSPVAAPYTRTLTPAGGWTEDFEDNSGSGTGVEAFVSQAVKQLTGQAGVAQTGYVATPSNLTTHMTGYATTIVVAPSGTVPVVADAGPDQAQIEPFATIQLNGSGSTGTGLTYSWRRVSGPNTFGFSSLTAMSPTVTVRGDINDSVLVLGLIVTDSHGVASTEATVSIGILAATEFYLPLGSSTWTPMQFKPL